MEMIWSLPGHQAGQYFHPPASGGEGSLLCWSSTFKVGLFLHLDFLVGREGDTMVGAGGLDTTFGAGGLRQFMFTPCRNMLLEG